MLSEKQEDSRKRVSDRFTSVGAVEKEQRDAEQTLRELKSIGYGKVGRPLRGLLGLSECLEG